MSTQKDAEQHGHSATTYGDDKPIRILDTDGTVLPDAEVPDLSADELVSMYEDIKLARKFDQRAISLQRQGRIATYAPMTGQEGAQVATSYALDDQDWLFPTYREHAAKYVHGMELESLLKPLCGHRDGYAIPDGVPIMPEYIPIATQIPQATGMAWGNRLQGNPERAALCHFGDGATSEGDFHEGLNFAGVFDVPVVFVCNNNQWAISVPRDHQTASETIAQKAAAYGIEGIRVDGLDPLAMYSVTSAALQKAKNPTEDDRRPTLIESVQYRYGAHTTADDPSAYRDEDEANAWREKDPLDRLQNYLTATDILDDELEAEIDDRIESRLTDAVETVENATTDPDSMFDHVYAELPDRLRNQRDRLRALREKYGDDAFSEVLE
ncbi:pyruvate dehydrogenase (acetyl-transferring) E1 component subunit alpha [Natrialba asiatica]|uniref:Pyruvate dehydrogenase (Acetyl-transferring) E1 component subunit alpha n=1 Tax=Natrialba asiatica (strain ATCC 700177 / DSM 12278 / JCM 9576 / FERM P-10747 / NBRC 102637 / 172P1) TaxID=29540 RepID=M0B7A9_NATA1|nr:pyruvate dehydrogenase (acetyl-transferring) E1 component subunit alpha [Natrialba asiatica]ELZ05504.1 pyruvate dehydrogenase (acetyl-transferring) E1 component subunit alpha [Natrialba asiatica DSM 12278]